MPLTKQTVETMLEKVKLAHKKLHDFKPTSLAHVIEARFTLWRLETVLNSAMHYHEIELIRLLKERWCIIKNSNMQYLHDFTNPANEACIDIAKILAKILAKIKQVSYLEILMPDLSETPAVDYLTSSYNEDDIDLRALILCDRSQHIIHVEDVLESSQDDGVLKCNYLVKNKVINLSPSEKERLLSRHPTVRATFDALQARIKFMLEGDTVGSAVSKLIQGLRDGGKAKSGSERESGAAANEAIFLFNQYRETLSLEKITILDNVSKMDNFFSKEPEQLSFSTLWTYLSEPKFQQDGTQVARYCVEMVALKIQELLEHKPELYKIRSYEDEGLKEISDVNLAVGVAMKNMKASLPLLEHHYCYSDTPSKTLCLALFQNNRRFLLNADEIAYFFNEYIKLSTQHLVLKPLNKLVNHICKTYSERVVKDAIGSLDKDSQTIMQREFKLSHSPLYQLSVFKAMKRGASEVVDINATPLEKYHALSDMVR